MTDASTGRQLSLGPRFNAGFVGYLAGRIITDPITALVELVANAWDAFATRVDITLQDDSVPFSIEDNGHGMSPGLFVERWETLLYRRREAQSGDFAEMPPGYEDVFAPRRVFGRNGKGRYAAFCFGEVVRISSWRDGHFAQFRVKEGVSKPVDITLVNSGAHEGHGTRIEVEVPSGRRLAAERARHELGLRFLTAPDFEVFVDGERVQFSDLPNECLADETIDVRGVGKIHLTIIEGAKSAITSQRRGIAWIVQDRRVGTCSWDGFKIDGEQVDRRRRLAKTLTFLVRADCLEPAGAVLEDWSGFRKDNSAYGACLKALEGKAQDWLDETTKEERREIRKRLRQANARALARLRPLGRERWTRFVDAIIQDCPSIQDKDVEKLASLLAKLESTDNKYDIIHYLEEAQTGDLDGLTEALDHFSVGAAKVVLDELVGRLNLLEQLERKLSNPSTREVQEMQPLFERGLWIFGPEFESVHFTSNRGMTQVLQMFGIDSGGSLNRPDFVVLPEGSLGAYSRPDYDTDDGHERGIASVVIVELKRPGVVIGPSEQAQVRKYARELANRGAIQKGRTIVTGYVVGDTIDALETEPAEYWDRTLRIVPLTFDDFISRARSRTFNLLEKVRSHHTSASDDLNQFCDGEFGEPLLL